MFPMSSACARGGPSRSSSAVVVDTARGYHDLKIDGSSLSAPAGERVYSCPFTVGGHRWRIKYYPNGDDAAESAGHISLYLSLYEDAAEPVKAQFTFSVLVRRRRALFFLRLGASVLQSTETSFAFQGDQRALGYPKFAKRTALAQLLRLHGCDRFTVRCGIIVLNRFRAVAEAAATMAPPSVSVPPGDLHRHLGELLHNGQGSDVVFEVGGDNFAAHRCVLAARSPVFSAQLFGEMREGGAGGGAIRVDDMEAPVFKALLCFVYTESLPDITKDEQDAMYQHLLVAADRYDLGRLKLICEDKLCKRIGAGTVETIQALAEKHHCDVLKKACLEFISSEGKQPRAVVAPSEAAANF